MKNIARFVSIHMNDDITRLILDREKWPDIDMDMAVNCIESRRKLKGKIQEWYDDPDLVFPLKLSAEQCSSAATASYKASLAERIAGYGGNMDSWRIADLTGGLGADSWFFSKRAEKVLYNEMQSVLCEAARHNFQVLEAGNIVISNKTAVSGHDPEIGDQGMTPSEMIRGFRPDIVYMDPARRDKGGRKVFLIEDCTPDVLSLTDDIFTACRHILIKLSPMADISMTCSRLGGKCREVHTVACGGECKELLIWMDREWNGEEYTVTAAEVRSDGTAETFSFTLSQEKASRYLTVRKEEGYEGKYLFEPGKALMKAGPFNLISERFGILKSAASTHLYMTDNPFTAEKLKSYGKVFSIIREYPLDKRSLKAIGKEFPKAEVTARNIPMDSDTLRKKTGVASGDDAHIFGIKSDSSGNIILAGKRF